MSSVKRTYNGSNKWLPSPYLFPNLSSVERSYNATNKQVNSQ